METRIALLGIMVEDLSSTEQLNQILHEHAQWVVGRMGIPYRERGVCIISVVVDAPQAVISALSGKVGMLPGITIKTIYSKTGGTP
ncbi:MAG: iron-only hydrogenase system regulator [Eubacteriales bacterium]|nr:iron-only hydrogenase system regulator [Eubacteriales bacterium]